MKLVKTALAKLKGKFNVWFSLEVLSEGETNWQVQLTGGMEHNSNNEVIK